MHIPDKSPLVAHTMKITLPRPSQVETAPPAVELIHALVWCSDLETRCSVAKGLLQCGVTPTMAHSDRDVFIHLAKESCAFIFCEDVFLGVDLCDILEARRFKQPTTSLIVLSSKSIWDAYLLALRTKALDYIKIPVASNEIGRILTGALRAHL
jgi:DNA-binding NtrC family response regulator